MIFSIKNEILVKKRLNFFLFSAKSLENDMNIICFFRLNGVVVWLNLCQINIILFKKNLLFIISNIEYLIIKLEILGHKRRGEEEGEWRGGR